MKKKIIVTLLLTLASLPREASAQTPSESI
jgi:hypothetical protein